MDVVPKEYDVKLDHKKRLTIRGTQFEFYHVLEFSDGTLVLKPGILVDPIELSENTLRMMDKSIENIKYGKVSKPVDIKKYEN